MEFPYCLQIPCKMAAQALDCLRNISAAGRPRRHLELSHGLAVAFPQEDVSEGDDGHAFSDGCWGCRWLLLDGVEDACGEPASSRSCMAQESSRSPTAIRQ